MTDIISQEERLDFLISEFASESQADIDIPKKTAEKQQVLRSLMNVRMPKAMSQRALDVQDAYLRDRAMEKGVVGLDDIPLQRDYMSIWQGDITRLSVDAIVNAANSQMLGCFVPMHTCIDKAAPCSITQVYGGTMERCL